MAIKRVVDMEWKNFIQQRPLNVSPAFAASPQAVYFGSHQREDGQIVHDLVNLNAVQVLYNKEDGKPFQSPSATSTVWPLEVPYPSDARIQQVMEKFKPLDHRGRESANAPDNPSEEKTAGVSSQTVVTQADQSGSFNESLMEGHNSDSFDSQLQYLHYPDEESSMYVHKTRESTPDSLPDLESVSSSEEPSPAWSLPSESGMLISDEGKIFDSHWEIDQSIASTAYPTPRESPVPALREAMQQGNSGSVTVPLVTVPPAAINPVALQLQNLTREELIIRNLHEVLGLDPTEPQNWTKIQEVARVAEQQAHEAFVIISQQINGYFSNTDSVGAGASARPPFNLTMGLPSVPVGGTREMENDKSQSGNTGASIGPRPAVVESDHSAAETSSLSFSATFSSIPLLIILQSKRLLELQSQNEIINIAIQRVLSEAPHLESRDEPPVAPPFATLSTVDEDSEDDTSSMDTNEFLATVGEIAGYPPIIQNFDGTDSVLGGELYQWVEDQMEREDFTRRWDSGFGGEPWHNARQAAYYSLRPLLDFAQMAADRLRDLRPNAETVATAPRNQSGESQDVPMNVSASHVPPSSAFLNNDVDHRGSEHGAQNAEDKHHTDGREGNNSGERSRQRFRKSRGDALRRMVTQREGIKASRLAEPGVLGFLAYVRRGLLEGGRRVEAFLVREKCDFRVGRRQYFEENEWLVDTERDPHKFISCRRLRHPLLFDLEAAKLQVLLILLRQQDYHELAWVLGDLLRLRFRDDYAIAHLLGAGFLDFVPPDLEAPGYWDIYSDPESSMDATDLGNSSGQASEGGTDSEERAPASTNFHADVNNAEIADGQSPGRNNQPSDSHDERPIFRVPPELLSRREVPRVVVAN
ncbi:hypothetical protein B0H13DRAFT_1922610 [Mycena leptocephala]|nr:hypothetical protein B0H13DRAFT_1922610 [Mycena leptocephala]